MLVGVWSAFPRLDAFLTQESHLPNKPENTQPAFPSLTSVNLDVWEQLPSSKHTTSEEFWSGMSSTFSALRKSRAKVQHRYILGLANPFRDDEDEKISVCDVDLEAGDWTVRWECSPSASREDLSAENGDREGMASDPQCFVDL